MDTEYPDMFRDWACGRYGLKASPKAVQDHYHLAKPPKELPISFNISPGNTMPVVVADEDGKPKLEMMKWGLVPSWWNKPIRSGQFFNARDDNVFKSGLWRGIYRKRALVPATGYFEWTKVPKGSKDPKHKFWYHPKQQDIFSFAGIYDIWKDAEGKNLMTYTLVTTEPNKEASKVHDRMPVLLHQEDEAAWLEPSRNKREEIEPLLRPLEDGALEVVEVSNDTRSFEYNDEGLTAPLNSK